MKTSISSTDGTLLVFKDEELLADYYAASEKLNADTYKSIRDKYGIYASNQGVFVKCRADLNEMDSQYMEDLYFKYFTPRKETPMSTEAKVIEVIEEQLIVKAALNDNFRDDLGADSLDFAGLIQAFELAFEISITDAQARTIRTVKDAVELVADAVHYGGEG